MTDSFDESVTQWITRLKQGDEDAAGQLWDRYFGRLVAVARKKLGSVARRVADEEDVAVSAFSALCRGAQQGRFEQLSDRDDLWRLLVAITAKEAMQQIRHEHRAKRGGGRVRGNSLFMDGDAPLPHGFDQFLRNEPTPDFMVLLDEQHRRLFDALRDDTLRQVARFRCEGYANTEIADKMGISLRSVERKLKLIRDDWSEEI